MIKRAIAAIVLLSLAAFVVWRIWVDQGTQTGLIAGLSFGILLGPARIAGVDFRQWFRNPNTPSELGDDTFIGLVRSTFHALWGSGLIALVILSFAACGWASYSCRPFNTSVLLALWEIILSAGRILLGALVGLAIVQTLVEFVWRAGLAYRLPPPKRAADYLAMQPLPYLPPKQGVPGRRRLIVCCDGTWNWPEPERETNVVRLVRALTPQDGAIAQIVHYHQGVGTGNFIDRIVGGGVGVGLAASVKACYGFLTDNYKPGDEIFLFGFSRGAYVVRSLSGMIGTLGMLRKEDMARFGEAWNWYWQDRAKRDPEMLKDIAPKRHTGVEIECVGVWDTVGALGIPGSRVCRDAFAFHETQLGPHVRHAFQALAIDEQRGNFQGAIWVPSGETDISEKNRQAGGPQQLLKQVWFPGVHSNIGGGYEEHGLSDTAFVWMLSQLAARQMLSFEQDCIQRSLDRQPEIFPVGALEDSRNVFWKLLGSPIPRPVCVVSDTEYLHESAALRAQAVAARRDLYKGRRRRAWMTAMSQQLQTRPNPSLIATREPDEVRIGGLGRLDPITPIKFKKKLDWCSWALELVSARS